MNTRHNVASEPTLWSREFWSELVNCTRCLKRYDNQAEVAGWKIRLVWEDEGRGTIYLHRTFPTPRKPLGMRQDLRNFVFLAFDPRFEARSLLDRLYRVDMSHRLNRK